MSAHLDIKTVRQKLGWTQLEMAEHLGLDRSNISRYETGQQELKGPAKKLFDQLAAEVSARSNDLEAAESSGAA